MLCADPETRDLLGGTAAAVNINPLEFPQLLRSASEILNRINEISFNSSLLREMRALVFASKLIDQGRVLDNAMKQMLLHEIESPDVTLELRAIAKLNAD